jgi:hypothetical protein
MDLVPIRIKHFVLILGLVFFSNILFSKNTTNIPASLSQKIEIPFEYVNGLIELNIKMNSIPLKFIYDTGAEHTILSKKEIAGLIGLKILKEIKVYGADFNKQLSAYITNPVDIILEDRYEKQDPILILSDDIFSFNNIGESTIHGIIGASFFRHKFIKIDYLKQILTIYPYDYKLNMNGFEEMPVTFYGHKPVIQSKIIINKQDTSISTKILMDTGSSVPLIFMKTIDSKFKLPKKLIKGRLGIGLGGDLEGWIGLINKVNLGNFKFNELICKFQDIDSLVISETSTRRNGIVGNEVLRKFTIIIDNIHKKLYFKPNRLYKKKIKYDKSGITLFAAGKNFDKFYIKYIIPDSPAGLAGLKPNDRIISVQYISTIFWGMNGIVNLFKKKENKKIRLKIIRDNKKYVYIFRLKDMFH